MLTLLTGTASCPCCAYAMSPAALRPSRFACTPVEDKAPAVPRDAPPAWAGDVRLDGGRVVDPRDGSVVENASILVRQGRIVAVDQGGSVKSDPSVQRIDATGKYVVPGYNDMHSHVLELKEPSGALALMLAEGVTGFRQMSGSPERLAERRNGALPVGERAPAALEMPGTILTPLNAASIEAVTAEIRLQKSQGADFIKVGFVSPQVFAAAMEEGHRCGIALLGHLQDGVDTAEAAKAGFRSVEHLGPGATVWTKCSSVEHELQSDAKPIRMRAPPMNIPFLREIIMWRFRTMLINPSAFVPQEYTVRLRRAFETFDREKFEQLAALFIEQDTWHVPTLVRLRTQELAGAPEYAEHPFLQYMPLKSIRKWRQVTDKFKKLPQAMRDTYAEAYPRQLELTKHLADSGVKMMTGTDGGWLSNPGLSLEEEFAELGKAGLSSLQILQMATINAAEYLGREDTMGTVEPGRNADLVLLDANPLEAVANLHAIAGVVRAGVYYARIDLDAMRDKVRASRGYLH